MCKTLRTYKVIGVFDYFFVRQSSYRYDFLNFWIFYLFIPTRLSYYSSKLSNVREKNLSNPAKLSGPVRFLPEPDSFAGFGKSAGFRPEPELWPEPELKSGTALLAIQSLSRY